MSTSKVVNLSKLLTKSTGLWLSPARSIYLSSRSDVFRNRFDDGFFGVASNLIRGLDREFDYMRRQMEKNFRNFDNFRNLRLSLKPGADDLISVDKEGNRRFQISFDMKEFDPQDIKVRTDEHNLIISAKKERKSENDYYLKEFSQAYELPKDLKLEELKSKWSDDGILTIDAPLPKSLESPETKIKEIPIEHGHQKQDKQKLSSGDEQNKK